MGLVDRSRQQMGVTWTPSTIAASIKRSSPPKELGSHIRKPKRTFLLRVVLRWLFIIKAPTFADKLEEDIDES